MSTPLGLPVRFGRWPRVFRLLDHPSWPKVDVYRGPDRRHLIARTTGTADPWWASAAAASVIAVPLLAAAFMTGSVSGLGAWETSIGDASLIGYGAAALLLGLRWRFVGEAACIPLAAAAAVTSLGFVPPVIHAGVDAPQVMALRLVSGIVLVVLMVRALRIEEVRSDLRPVRSVALTFLLTGLLAVAMSLGPLRTLVGYSADGVRVSALAESAVQIAVAAAVACVAVARGRRLFAGVAAVACAVAVAGVLRAIDPTGSLLDIAALCLLAGAVLLVLIVAGELQSAISAVVRQDVRGSRRWETAEAELHEIQASMRGRRHDVRNILNGVDGSLLVLASERDAMPEGEINRLIAALRQEVYWLQLVVGESIDARSYDLSDLLRALVDVRGSACNDVVTSIEPALVVEGRPDRLALAVDNLLVNVAVHAPGAIPLVAARRVGVAGETVEISISDDGPGLLKGEFALACRSGWRSERSCDRPGSGLGLAQVHDLMAAEGGEVLLEPTQSTQSSAQGLTVRLRLPVFQPI